jgi:hypothetical protein
MLCYNAKVRGLHSRRSSWILQFTYSFQPHYALESTQPLIEMRTGNTLREKGGLRVSLATSPSSVSRLSRKYGILDVSRQIRKLNGTPSKSTTSMKQLKTSSSAGNGAQAKGTASRVIVASRPKVSFLSYRSTSPGYYEWLLVLL